MHEFSITSRIVNCVLEEAKKHNARRVNEVHLVVGKLTFLGLEQVRFAYEMLVKNTILEDSKLHIEEKDGAVKCDRCGYAGDLRYEDDPVYHVPSPTLVCPKCEGAVNIVGGKECTIKRLKLVA
ncbi:MAG: hydrogenase maturation nickel metallochaperone HypA [Candidatus Bathyarchaeota archaeon]|nr:MAG: hydrogenase maturation nickel metallochaperone HypA [Candidatus Bathyarchaeota archaeon]